MAEELSTRKIAKARIHVERLNQRLKQFKLVGRTIPLSLAPLELKWLWLLVAWQIFRKFFVSNLSIPILLCREHIKIFRAT